MFTIIKIQNNKSSKNRKMNHQTKHKTYLEVAKMSQKCILHRQENIHAQKTPKITHNEYQINKPTKYTNIIHDQVDTHIDQPPTIERLFSFSNTESSLDYSTSDYYNEDEDKTASESIESVELQSDDYEFINYVKSIQEDAKQHIYVYRSIKKLKEYFSKHIQNKEQFRKNATIGISQCNPLITSLQITRQKGFNVLLQVPTVDYFFNLKAKSTRKFNDYLEMILMKGSYILDFFHSQQYTKYKLLYEKGRNGEDIKRQCMSSFFPCVATSHKVFKKHPVFINCCVFPGAKTLNDVEPKFRYRTLYSKAAIVFYMGVANRDGSETNKYSEMGQFNALVLTDLGIGSEEEENELVMIYRELYEKFKFYYEHFQFSIWNVRLAKKLQKAFGDHTSS